MPSSSPTFSSFSVTVSSLTASDVADTNFGTLTGVENVNFDGNWPRKVAHLDAMDYSVGVSSWPCCKQTGSVLCSEMLGFQCALQTHYLQCDNCNDCIGTLTDVGVEVVGVISLIKAGRV